ncbi:MAG TPA: histidine kinase [Flavisolibacter sp.]|nr:histidine kinase [Flavisolibacter sp.]
MRSLFNIKRFRIYLWIGLIFLVLSSLHELANSSSSFGYRVINHIWILSYITVFHYFLFEYIIPGFRRKRLMRSILLLIIQVFFYSWGLYLWRLLGIGLHIYMSLINYSTVSHAVAEQMSYSFVSLFFYTIARHVYNHIKLRQTAQQLRIEKQAAELSYLKSQTNPHFLFNTLNNIYSLSRIKSDLAPESILRLSKIMRFMLYETSEPYISIEQEVKIICDYIALEQLRYDESLRIEFNHDIENMKQALPPLLLMPLVENAFKHGVSETRSHPFVHIHLSIRDRQLELVVKNSSEGKALETVKENIGLSNLRRQLELLYTDFALTVQQGHSDFTATLKINLASHV